MAAGGLTSVWVGDRQTTGRQIMNEQISAFVCLRVLKVKSQLLSTVHLEI